MHSRILFAAVPVVLCATLAGSAAAQRTTEIGPFVAYYRPLGSFDPEPILSTDLPQTPQDLAGPAFGLQVRSWLGRRFGAEVQAAASHSEVPSGITPAGPRGPYPVQVQMLTAQGLLNVIEVPAAFRIWVGAGPGIVRHTGDSYSRYGTPTDFAGALSAGAQIDLSQRLRLTGGVNTLVYQIDVPMSQNDRDAGSLEHGTQYDALFHAGLEWRIGGR